MTSNGPTNLFPGIPQVKAAIRLDAGVDGLVLVEQTALDQSGLEARVQTAKANTAYLLDNDVPLQYVDGVATDQFGFRRDPLTINSTTVAGTYNLVFKVDTLELPITLVIKNPTPKVFVMSARSATPVTVSFPTNATGTPFKFSAGSKAAEAIKFFDEGTANGNDTNGFDELDEQQAQNASDLFANSVNGVYTIELKTNYNATASNSGLFGRIAVADLPVGVYDFKVVKTYPDGRVETVQDKAQVTELDANQVAVFGSPTVTGVNNTKFLDKFIISETSYVKGTYTFEFTIGTITKKYTINVLDRPMLKVSSIKLGSNEGALLGTTYTFVAAVDYAESKLNLDFTLQNLLTDYYVSFDDAAADATGKFAVNALANSGDTASGTAKILLSDLKSITLGTLSADTPASDERITVTVRFWKRVNYSENANRFVLVGEPQLIYVGFKAVVA
jgi:5-hydroxyisourate hydrolase-like protein (transthyretin family)